jgi:hypothetical protein
VRGLVQRDRKYDGQCVDRDQLNEIQIHQTRCRRAYVTGRLGSMNKVRAF